MRLTVWILDVIFHRFVGRGLDLSTGDKPNHPGRRGRRPLHPYFKKATSIGWVKPPPYSTIGKGDVGADARHRPASLTLHPLSPSIACQKTSVGGDACIAPQAGARPSGPMTSIGPYSMGAEEFRPRRGQSGEGHKSVKKNAVIPAFFSFWVLRPQLWGS